MMGVTMASRSTPRRLFFVVLLVALFLTPSTALAAKPSTAGKPHIVTFDMANFDPFLSEVCGVPVEQRNVGRAIVFFDPENPDPFTGSRITIVHATTTFTNLDTGESVVIRTALREVNRFGSDGETITIHFERTGLLDQVVIPGQGVVFLNTGIERADVILDADTGELIDFTFVRHGHEAEGDFVELLCSALAS
jgi:hypothetical protein